MRVEALDGLAQLEQPHIRAREACAEVGGEATSQGACRLRRGGAARGRRTEDLDGDGEVVDGADGDRQGGEARLKMGGERRMRRLC